MIPKLLCRPLHRFLHVAHAAVGRKAVERATAAAQRASKQRLFVEVYAQARSIRYLQTAVFYHPVLAHGLVAIGFLAHVLEDEKIRCCQSQMRRSCRRQRSLRVVRRHLHIIGLGQRGDLLDFTNAAGVAHIGLDHI